MLKREWCAESNGKLPHLLIPSKTATLVLEFAVEDLPLGRTAVLVLEFAVKDLPLGRTLVLMMIDKRTGEWTKLHKAELYALYSSPNIIRNFTLRLHGQDMDFSIKPPIK